MVNFLFVVPSNNIPPIDEKQKAFTVTKQQNLHFENELLLLNCTK